MCNFVSNGVQDCDHTAICSHTKQQLVHMRVNWPAVHDPCPHTVHDQWCKRITQYFCQASLWAVFILSWVHTHAHIFVKYYNSIPTRSHSMHVNLYVLAQQFLNIKTSVLYNLWLFWKTDFIFTKIFTMWRTYNHKQRLFSAIYLFINPLNWRYTNKTLHVIIRKFAGILNYI